jgi:ABC-type transport system involved in multi-copper enzyme maturation permease subunit
VTAALRLFWNPIVAKELRSRMRGWHAAALLSGYLCVIGGIGYLVYSSQTGALASVTQLGGAGLTLFKVLAGAVMASVALVVPGLVGPAVSGERERQTLDLLLVTPLRPARIVVGKLLAALAFVALLVLACVPLFSVSFLLGGVPASLVAESVAFIFLAALTLGSVAMLASVALRRPSSSTVVSYLALLAVTLGPFLAGFATEGTALSRPAASGNQVPAVYALSPVTGAAELLAGTACTTPGPVAPGWYGYAPIRAGPLFVNWCSGSVNQPTTTSLGPLGNWPTWTATCLFDGAIALSALGVSVVVLRRREVS